MQEHAEMPLLAHPRAFGRTRDDVPLLSKIALKMQFRQNRFLAPQPWLTTRPQDRLPASSYLPAQERANRGNPRKVISRPTLRLR
jgi:hypothetical protein